MSAVKAGAKLAKRNGFRKAKVAVARKLAVTTNRGSLLAQRLAAVGALIASGVPWCVLAPRQRARAHGHGAAAHPMR